MVYVCVCVCVCVRAHVSVSVSARLCSLCSAQWWLVERSCSRVCLFWFWWTCSACQRVAGRTGDVQDGCCLLWLPRLCWGSKMYKCLWGKGGGILWTSVLSWPLSGDSSYLNRNPVPSEYWWAADKPEPHCCRTPPFFVWMWSDFLSCVWLSRLSCMSLNYNQEKNSLIKILINSIITDKWSCWFQLPKCDCLRFFTSLWP